MTGRTVWAVAAGLLTVLIVTTVVDGVLHLTGVFPTGQPLTHGLAALGTAYRAVITVAAAWLTARLAPRDPMRQALVRGCLGTLLALAGLIATWNMGLGPRWYPLALVILAIPQCWVGGWLYTSRA